MRSVRLSEHVLQRQYHLSGGRGINLSQMPTEPRTVQRPHLIQRNFALMPLKGAIHAKWKSFLCTGQWSDNHCADGTVHFLRRDHEAWPRLAHFRPHARIKCRQIHAKSLDHHVHSFLSNSLVISCHSRNSSASSPCSANAFLMASSQPARGFSGFWEDRKITLSPRTVISMAPSSPACSIIALGSRMPREFPIRTSFAVSVARRAGLLDFGRVLTFMYTL